MCSQWVVNGAPRSTQKMVMIGGARVSVRRRERSAGVMRETVEVEVVLGRAEEVPDDEGGRQIIR